MSNISVIHNIDRESATLPEKYESAKQALSSCFSIDECKVWADKAAALASYAKQAADTELEDMAKRIRGRAIRRCGILMSEFDGRPDNAKKQMDGSDRLFTKTQAAKEAGMSERQVKTATRLANIPEDIFNSKIDANDVPTITELSEIGTKKVVVPVDPKQHLEGFQDAMYLSYDIKDLYERIKKAPEPNTLILAMFDEDIEMIKKLWPKINAYINELI